MTRVNDRCHHALMGIATGFARHVRRCSRRNLAIRGRPAPPPTGNEPSGGRVPSARPLSHNHSGRGVCRLSPYVNEKNSGR